MAQKAILKAEPRDATGKGVARKLRAAGRIPAVLYGHGVDTRSLTVDAHEFQILMSHARVENTIVTLEIDGAKKKGAEIRALMREVQTHAYRNEVLHVDFYQVRADETVEVEVPIRLTGTAAGVKEGGILQQGLHDIPVECLPDQIPEAIEIDVTALSIGDSIHVSDIPAPEGVEILLDPERTVCSVIEPTVVALETEAEAPAGVGGEIQPALIRDRGEEQADATETGEKG